MDIAIVLMLEHQQRQVSDSPMVLFIVRPKSTKELTIPREVYLKEPDHTKNILYRKVQDRGQRWRPTSPSKRKPRHYRKMARRLRKPRKTMFSRG